ncbi:hypothetical protein Mapa_014553 [Marchantia paleacea]|nr:hypothetical protein Mapa_014553 [Marchantia paleacea]
MGMAEHILSSEPIQSSSLSLQRVHHIHGSDSLSPCVLCICHRISDHVLQKDLQNSASLFINQPTDTLHSSSSGQAPDGGLRYPLNVVSEHLPVTLSASFAQTFTSLSASRHGCELEGFESSGRKFAERCGKKLTADRAHRNRITNVRAAERRTASTEFPVSDIRVCRQAVGLFSRMC